MSNVVKTFYLMLDALKLMMNLLEIMFKEGPEGVKWDWDLGVFEAGKWDLMHWEWELSPQKQ